ncbi:MAG: PTS transporter subunit IIC [Erysipelotrichia bacterium]|nr:PTS transporter subunit IIC [Erysipelotrichia bacterium]
MEFINSIIQFVMDLGGSVFLPIMITILGLIFGIKFFDSLKSGLRIGIGFIGINTILSLLINGLDPVVNHYVGTGAGFVITDIGWEGVASIAWSTKFALIIVPLGMILNYILIRVRFTKTMDVDIWNYFHFILGSAVAYYVALGAGLSDTVATVIGIVFGLLTFMAVLKFADIIAPKWQQYYGLEGTTCCNNDAYLTWLINWLVCKLMNLIPGVKNVRIDLKWINDKLGSFGETSIITFFVGILLCVLTGQDLGTTLTVSVTLCAAIILLPRMVSLLMEGLVPISNAARKFFQKHLGDEYEINIGMDEALCLGDQPGLECAVIMIPITVAVAFLPGVGVFPLAALGSLAYTTCMCSLYAEGDILKIIVSSTANMIYCLYAYTFMSPLVTEMALKVGYITSASTLVTGDSIQEWNCMLVGILGKLFKAW